MGKRKSMIVNGELFKTKKDLEERVRGIVASYKDGERVNMFDFPFMLDLLRNHPHADTKIGGGVAYMYVQRNPVYPSTRGFYLVRLDGSETDFSWRECMTPTPQGKKIRMACRVLVEPYTMDFKQRFFDERGGVATCDITGQEITFLGSHVDHKPPNTFEKIFTDFVQEYEVDIEAVELRSERADNRIQDELADEELARRWVDYHNQHAELRIVSPLANLSHIKVGEEGG